MQGQSGDYSRVTAFKGRFKVIQRTSLSEITAHSPTIWGREKRPSLIVKLLSHEAELNLFCLLSISTSNKSRNGRQILTQYNYIA